MFNWLSKLPISHFGVLDPKFRRGYYTGIGKALFKIDTVNNELTKIAEDDYLSD